MLKLKVKLIESDSTFLPSYGHEGDAGLDLRTRERVELHPGERAIVPTGIAMELPEGYVGLIWDKSGVAQKRGIKTLGGVTDATYRGEIKVGLVNLSNEVCVFEKGDKVAQMLIQKYETVSPVIVDELSVTKRGEDGWGSTGD